jgi:hypothetical protein
MSEINKVKKYYKWFAILSFTNVLLITDYTNKLYKLNLTYLGIFLIILLILFVIEIIFTNKLFKTLLNNSFKTNQENKYLENYNNTAYWCAFPFFSFFYIPSTLKKVSKIYKNKFETFESTYQIAKLYFILNLVILFLRVIIPLTYDYFFVDNSFANALYRVSNNITFESQFFASYTLIQIALFLTGIFLWITPLYIIGDIIKAQEKDLAEIGIS